MGRNEHTVAWSNGLVHFLSESSLQYGSGVLKAKSFLQTFPKCRLSLYGGSATLHVKIHGYVLCSISLVWTAVSCQVYAPENVANNDATVLPNH